MSSTPQIDRKTQTVGKTHAVPSPTGGDVTESSEYRDPLVDLLVALHELPLPAPSSFEIQCALHHLARYAHGQTCELCGLAAWLDFLRAPWPTDEPLEAADAPGPEYTELSRTIGAALDWAVAHPDEVVDSLPGLDTLSEGCALAFDPAAVPPFDRYQALRNRERTFKYAIDHKGDALPFTGYEALLAEHAVADGWSDQEVINLLIYNRRRWLEDLIPDRSIIDVARANVAGATPERPAAEPATATPTAVDLSPAIAILRRALGLAVARVRKLGRKRGVFELVLEDGTTVDLGTASALLSHREVQAAVMDATGRTIPLLKGEVWRKVVDSVLGAATVEETDNAPEQETWSWLRTAKARCACITLDRAAPSEMAKVLRDGTEQAMYLGHGEVFVCLPAFIRYVHVNTGARITWPDMSLRLRRIGFRPEQVAARDHEGTVKVRLWVSPPGVDLDS